MRPSGPGPAEYVRLLHRTINDIVPGASEGDVPLARLKTGLAAVTSRISEQATLEEITSAVNAATELLRNYHSTAAQRAVQQLTELKGVMRTMTDTITFLSESRSTVVHQLTFVERQLEEATELEDIRLLRPRIAECLEMVRHEAARLQAESEAHTEAVRQKMGMPAGNAETNNLRKPGSLDLATGLPSRGAAERFLAEKTASGLRCSIGLFVPERLGFVARRHGREAEDQVLLHVAQHLAKIMPPGAHLYRWTGAALLAIRVSSDTSQHDEQVWRQLASKPCEKTIGNERRSALLRITLACMVRNTDASTQLNGILEEMDGFVTQYTQN